MGEAGTHDHGEPLVLLQGLAWPRAHWDDALCDALADAGFDPIRVDVRDVGGSEYFGGTPPSIGRVIGAALAGQPTEGAPYDLSDMARDVIALLDELCIERAHVCGVSLGGMIAQTLALEHPNRVRTLTSVMTSTGDPNRVLATSDALRWLFTPIPTAREAAIEHQVAAFRVLSGPAFDETRIRELPHYPRKALQALDAFFLVRCQQLKDNYFDGHLQAATISRHRCIESATTKVDASAALDRMDWRELECLVGALYDSVGYDVTVTTRSDDDGIDVLAKESDGATPVHLVPNQAAENRAAREFT